MFRSLICAGQRIRGFLLPGICLCVFAGCGARGEKMDIIERFDGNTFNRSLWEIAKPEESVGTVEVKDDALLFTIPPAPAARPQIRNNAKRRFNGDFVVQMDFELLDPLPAPEKDYINVELIAFGADGSAHLSRTNHHGAGNGIVSYFAPKAEHLKGHWQHSPSDAKTGTLKIKRIADRLEYLLEVNGVSSVVGTSDFGTGPVTGVGVAMSVSAPTTSPFRVQVDNLEIHTTPRPLSLPVGSSGIWTAAVLVATISLLGGWLYWTRKPVEVPVAEEAEPKTATSKKSRRETPTSLDEFKVD